MVDLRNAAALMLPWESDPWGRLRPPLSVDALRMSAMLAADTYQMEVEPWLQAGWREITIQVDGELTDGPESEQSPMGKLASAWRLYRVRRKMKGRNPISQVMGTLRQKEKSDTGKVLVMLRPVEHGRYVVAISFMGTGERLYDWISNFRMTPQQGVHKGFLQLARQFEENEEEIDFPETARELGLERLTLTHVLQEAQSPNSRFTLWLCGHSQGAALMQVYMHRKIHLCGVMPRNMVGYGFASPTVVTGLAVSDPAAYPIYHVINTDDLFARMGAQMHLGLCLMYPAQQDFRRACYGWDWSAEGQRQRSMVEPILRRMRDTSSSMEVLIAYLRELSRYTAQDIMESLGLMDQRLPVKKIFSAADARMDAFLRFLIRHMAAAHVAITGENVSPQRVADHQALIAQTMQRMGTKALAGVLGGLIRAPHRMAGARRGSMGAYPYIVLHGVEALVPAMWQAGKQPRMVHCTRAVAWSMQPLQPQLHNRRRCVPPRYAHRNMRYADPRERCDTRHHVPVLETGSVKPGERIVYVE